MLNQVRIIWGLGISITAAVVAVIGVISIIETWGASMPIVIEFVTALAGVGLSNWETFFTEESFINFKVALYNGCDEATGTIGQLGYNCTLYQLALLGQPVYTIYGMCVVLLGVDGMNRSIALKNPGDEICGGYENNLCATPTGVTYDLTLSQNEWQVLADSNPDPVYEAGQGFVTSSVFLGDIYSSENYIYRYLDVPSTVTKVSFTFWLDANALDFPGRTNFYVIMLKDQNGSVLVENFVPENDWLAGDNTVTLEGNWSNVDYVLLSVRYVHAQAGHVGKFKLVHLDGTF
jgi:hypothetical protein